MEIFSGLTGRGPVQPELTDAAILRAMLDAEIALARALVATGLAQTSAADEIAAACADADVFDIKAIGETTSDYGTPVPGLLSAIRARLGPEAAETLHRGATSQDIIDTAIVLVSGRALRPLDGELAAAQSCALVSRERTAPP